ncbi:Uncharacterized protein QJS10_CPA01g00094 [Acorus calamus]|uniref:Uncharacterized protein n=1 Tax=Acorus calamus TaxID=4465 RepID=A0AAV9FLX7_ACOCL|nr:Uncharacterized protein QJS10_CPA01g00094 [Acorus calamus]
MTTKRAAPNRPSFASCFGCVSTAGDVNEKSPTDQDRRRPRWFSWTRFRRRNSGTKTVPVDAPVPAPTRTIDVVEEEVEEIKTMIETPKKNRRQPSKGTIKDSEAQTTRLPSISTKYRRTSRTDSPKIASRSGSPSQSPPSSSPPHPFRARPIQPIGVSRFSGKRETGREGKYGPAVGMSVVAVMLVVMILFGRTCAVVCTCAWLFCLPRMRQAEPPPPAAADEGDGGVKWVSSEMDVESEEYKKKVVLEGFLERSRRRPVSGGL